jgi:hypothetical protein
MKFAKALLTLGEGKDQETDYGLITLEHVQLESYAAEEDGNAALIRFVYNDLIKSFNAGDSSNTDYLAEFCILALLSRDVLKINKSIAEILPGVLYHLKSIDIPNPDCFDSLPKECLNKMSMSGLPEHNLYLKVGMPVVIMQNLYIKKGVCNSS